eukprot:TRINITY_DN577_c0_g3_i9.p1 TRINITY_DN577_c0_g3~~TRINITY_DN577_c0_g3_i9.p1  ORF type:complete len:733 (+),score=156.03 TRINITY_DN577_c0_g3_i9:22-2220(+)
MKGSNNLGTLLNQTRQQLLPQLNAPHYKIERGFSQIYEMSKHLANKATGKERDAIKGEHFLANGAVDGDKMMRNLQHLDLKSTSFDSTETITPNQMENFLNHELEMAILTAVEETKKDTEETFYKNYINEMDSNWGKTRKRIAEQMSKSTWSSDASAYQTPSRRYPTQSRTPGYTPRVMRTPLSTPLPPGTPLYHSYPGTPGAPVEHGGVSEYSRVISELSDSIRHGNEYDICSNMYLASNNQGTGSLRSQITDSWDILRSMVSTDTSPEYFSEIHEDDESDLRRVLLSNSIKFLERQYLEYMQSVVRKNRETAELGGQIGIIPLIQSFLSVVDKEYRRDSGSWCLIYYCVRVGKFRDAKQVALQKGEEELAGYLDYYIHQRNGTEDPMSERRRAIIRNEYRELSTIQSTEDAYKSLLYNLLGKVNSKMSYQKYLQRQWKTPDYMWFQLSMIDSITPSEYSNFSLVDLQIKLVKYGPKHFNPNNTNPYLYFQILLLCQKFELAVNYLTQAGNCEVEAVHFAVALYYTGLLNQPSVYSEELYVETSKSATFSYINLMTMYVNSFSSMYPRIALHYIHTIRDVEVRNELIKDLVITTGDFEGLLGTETGGNQIQGSIFEIVPDEWKKIVMLAAQEPENNGQYERSIALYDLVEEYKKVVHVLSKQLSKVLTIQTPERHRLVEIATFQAQRYESTMKAAYEHRKLEKLLKLVEFFDWFNKKQYMNSLNVLSVDSF